MELSQAPLVVVLGAKARNLLRVHVGLRSRFASKATAGIDEEANLAVRRIGGRPRLVAYLWHPTGMTAPKTFISSYPGRIADLRALARGDMAATEFS